MDEVVPRAARNLSEILNSVGQVAASERFSSKILHYAVGPDYLTTQIVFASQWVADEVISKAAQQAERQIREFVAVQENNPQAAGLRGQVFEALAHKVLQRGGTFRIRPLGVDSQSADSSPASEQWPALVHKQFSKVTELGCILEPGSADNLYLVPAAKNNKAFDALRPPGDALQMTVSLKHPISHAGKSLVARLAHLTSSWQTRLPSHSYCTVKSGKAMLWIHVAYTPRTS